MIARCVKLFLSILNQQANNTSAEKEMKAQVVRCAKEITGDSRPRKLDPVVRAKVLRHNSFFVSLAFQQLSREKGTIFSKRRYDRSPIGSPQVMECAFAYMPEMDTDGLLRESERQLMASAKVKSVLYRRQRSSCVSEQRCSTPRSEPRKIAQHIQTFRQRLNTIEK